MAPVRRWNPTFTMLTALDDHEYADPTLDREYAPRANGLPELLPYRYRGSDFSDPPQLTINGRLPARRAVRDATLLDDPALRYAGLPFSRPQDWQVAS